MISNKILFFLFLTLLVTPVLNATSVYKWVDEDGQVHYGSKSDSKNAKEITIKNQYIDSGNATAPLSAEERAEKQKKFINALDEEKKSINEEKRKKKEQEELKVTRCNASRDQLRRAEGASALYDLDEKVIEFF